MSAIIHETESYGQPKYMKRRFSDEYRYPGVVKTDNHVANQINLLKSGVLICHCVILATGIRCVSRGSRKRKYLDPVSAITHMQEKPLPGS